MNCEAYIGFWRGGEAELYPQNIDRDIFADMVKASPNMTTEKSKGHLTYMNYRVPSLVIKRKGDMVYYAYFAPLNKEDKVCIMVSLNSVLTEDVSALDTFMSSMLYQALTNNRIVRYDPVVSRYHTWEWEYANATSPTWAAGTKARTSIMKAFSDRFQGHCVPLGPPDYTRLPRTDTLFLDDTGATGRHDADEDMEISVRESIEAGNTVIVLPHSLPCGLLENNLRALVKTNNRLHAELRQRDTPTGRPSGDSRNRHETHKTTWALLGFLMMTATAVITGGMSFVSGTLYQCLFMSLILGGIMRNMGRKHKALLKSAAITYTLILTSFAICHMIENVFWDFGFHRWLYSMSVVIGCIAIGTWPGSAVRKFSLIGCLAGLCITAPCVHLLDMATGYYVDLGEHVIHSRIFMPLFLYACIIGVITGFYRYKYVWFYYSTWLSLGAVSALSLVCHAEDINIAMSWGLGWFCCFSLTTGLLTGLFAKSGPLRAGRQPT